MVPSTACVWVMVVYLLVGTIMFAEWEGWNYLDSLYFCVTSLCKVWYYILLLYIFFGPRIHLMEAIFVIFSYSVHVQPLKGHPSKC